ncbi:MAG: SDR family NAD(P)-dependent oxidoreductase [Burkholderiaceae bacterium]|jgi:3-dehydrosphinganine reductase|nr:SDR family NAD(P)-dependent oxidoreductase [Burkholderiaceae bacterium]
MAQSRNVIITGGSSGLGLALAEALLRRGDHVLLLARDAAKLAAAITGLREKNPHAQVDFIASDVSGAQIEADIARAVQTLGGLDLLINSAGILREGYFEHLTEDDFRRTLDINFFGAVRVIRAALPWLRQSRGKIINISSVAGLTGVFGYAAYCSSKYALLGFSETLRAELKPQGIRVQVVCPPEFDSPMVDALDQGRTPENQAHALTIPKLDLPTVVNAIVAGLDRAQFIIIPGVQTRLMTFGLQHFPGISRWVSDLRIRASYRGPTHQPKPVQKSGSGA